MDSMDSNNLKKLIKFDAEELSLTPRPKTGHKFLFWKSDEYELENMNDEEFEKAVSNSPWNGDKSRYSIEQLARAVPSAVARWARSQGELKKENLKLPYKEPDGTINLNGVRAALAAIGGARTGQKPGLPSEVLSAARTQLEGILSRYKKSLEKGGKDMSDVEKTAEQLIEEEFEGSDLGDDTIVAMQKAMDILKPHSDSLPKSWMNGLVKTVENSNKKLDMETLKSYDVPEDLSKLFVGNIKENESLKKAKSESEEKVVELQKRLDEYQKKDDEAKKEEIRKSATSFAEEVPFLPVEKEELENFVYETETAYGKEHSDKVKDILKKAHDAIKKSTGEDGDTTITEDPNKGSVSGEQFRTMIFEKAEADTSEASKASKIAKAMREIARANPELVNAYNEDFRKGLVKSIFE